MENDSVIGEYDGKVLPKENIIAQVKEKLKRQDNEEKKCKREDRKTRYRREGEHMEEEQMRKRGRKRKIKDRKE